LVVFFVLIQISSLLLPPKIEIIYPNSDLSSDAPAVEIIGKVLRTKEFMINNQIVNFAKDGSFSYVLGLESGVNEIVILAKNSWGKTSTILRKVIYNSTTSTTLEEIDTSSTSTSTTTTTLLEE